MALLLVDQDKKRSQAIRSFLQGTPIGLNIESFSSMTEAMLWSRSNSCDIVLVEQEQLEIAQNLSALNALNRDVPVLILKSHALHGAYGIQHRVFDFLEVDFERAVLLQRIENVLNLQQASLHMRKANDDFPDEQRVRYELAVSGSDDGVWDWNLQDDEVYYSSRWCEIIGYHGGDLDQIPSTWLSRVHPDDVALLDTAIHSHITGVTERLSFEYRIRHKNGHYRWVLTRGKVVLDIHNRPWRMVGSQTDITERKNSEQLVAFNALHDPLTGLANRALLIERIEQMVLYSKRDSMHRYGLVFLDLDKFKEINDNLGHEAGDVVLKTVVQRLRVCVREGDTLARFGGDEFVVLVVGTCAEKDIKGLAERILLEMQKPIHVNGHELHVGISMGIVTETAAYEDAESGLRDADLALYQAKTKGRNRYEFFDSSLSMTKSKHFALQATLAGAIDRQELVMHYQPIYSLEKKCFVGVESLMRWRHPENGYVYPMDFIPVAEETGLINEMGIWSLYQSCQQLKAWREQIPDAKDFFISVNVSGRQLESENFIQQVKQALRESDLPGGCLVIEVTENILMHDIKQILPKFQKLKELGVLLAIDDFGTGYSSLQVLSDFPFDILKVAREFISDIPNRKRAERTVKLIHMLAKEMSMKTIVEGVETLQELNVINRIKCDLVQGYYFSKPKDADTITKILTDKSSHPVLLTTDQTA